MLLRNGGERFLDMIDQEDGEQNFLVSVVLGIKKANCELLPCSTVVHRDFDDVFGTAPVVDHDREVQVNGECRFTITQGAHDAHFTRVPCVEAAGVELAQGFQDFVARVQRIGVRKGFASVLKFWCAKNDVVGLFTSRQTVIL